MTRESNYHDNFNPDPIVEEIKGQFNQNTTVKTMAIYLLLNRPEFTHDQMATIVQLLKNTFGLQSNTSGSSIAWYKQDMKKKGNHEELKNTFNSHLNSLSNTERNEILLYLGNKYMDTLIKVADAADIEKHIPIKDIPENKPTTEQVKAAKANDAKAKETEIPEIVNTEGLVTVTPKADTSNIAELNPKKVKKAKN